tara:strand:+ start:495 stop:773 length:279 start_codon:yes stop_codon:yes gene_type:complete
MRYAIVKDSLVTNLVEWDGSSEYAVDGELIQADENAWIGGEYNGSFVARPPAPPYEPTAEELQKEADNASGRQKLLDLGLSESEVNALLGGS